MPSITNREHFIKDTKREMKLRTFPFLGIPLNLLYGYQCQNSICSALQAKNMPLSFLQSHLFSENFRVPDQKKRELCYQVNSLYKEGIRNLISSLFIGAKGTKNVQHSAHFFSNSLIRKPEEAARNSREKKALLCFQQHPPILCNQATDLLFTGQATEFRAVKCIIYHKMILSNTFYNQNEAKSQKQQIHLGRVLIVHMTRKLGKGYYSIICFKQKAEI